MRDYLDDFLAPDDSEIISERRPGVGIVSHERAKSAADLEQDERRMLAEPWDIEFREPETLTIADYEQAKALGLLCPDDEILVLVDLMTRIVRV
jgi:hypothetical protein